MYFNISHKLLSIEVESHLLKLVDLTKTQFYFKSTKTTKNQVFSNNLKFIYKYNCV